MHVYTVGAVGDTKDTLLCKYVCMYGHTVRDTQDSLVVCMYVCMYTVRDTKDTLVVGACGAESITFLKVYGVLPAATMFMVLYSKMSSVFTKDQVCLHCLFQ